MLTLLLLPPFPPFFLSSEANKQVVEEAMRKHAPQIIIWKNGRKPRLGRKREDQAFRAQPDSLFPSLPHGLGKTSDHSHRVKAGSEQIQELECLLHRLTGAEGLKQLKSKWPQRTSSGFKGHSILLSLSGGLLFTFATPSKYHLHWGISSEPTT